MQGAHADVLAIFGPTAVGKTAVAIAVAERLRAHGADPVAVSADALQLYRGLAILTGAADARDQHRLEHRLLGTVPIDQTCSAGAYARLAHAEIDALLAAGRMPIVVGGTGLYLRAALAELELHPPPAPGVRERLTAELEAEGPEALHARLAARAPQAAARITTRDRQRIVRALELLEQGVQAPMRGGGALWTAQTRHSTRLIGLTMERAALVARIDARIEAMLAAGVVDEVRAADAAGPSPTARRALGFEELLRGDVEAMRVRTRRYAKRQVTWMRRLGGVELVDVTGRDAEQVAAAIVG